MCIHKKRLCLGLEAIWKLKRAFWNSNVHSGIYGTCPKGKNPFDNFNVYGIRLSNYVPCYDPNPMDAYGDIKRNLEYWVEEAISNKRN